MNGFIIKNLWPAAKSFLHILMSPPLWTSHAFVVDASGVLCASVCVLVCERVRVCVRVRVGEWGVGVVVYAGLHVYLLCLCGAPTVQTKLTTPPINMVWPASSSTPTFNQSCPAHVYGNALVYITNSSLIADCIRSIFPQIISYENHQLRFCPTQCHQPQQMKACLLKQDITL